MTTGGTATNSSWVMQGNGRLTFRLSLAAVRRLAHAHAPLENLDWMYGADTCPKRRKVCQGVRRLRLTPKPQKKQAFNTWEMSRDLET